MQGRLLLVYEGCDKRPGSSLLVPSLSTRGPMWDVLRQLEAGQESSPCTHPVGSWSASGLLHELPSTRRVSLASTGGAAVGLPLETSPILQTVQDAE